MPAAPRHNPPPRHRPGGGAPRGRGGTAIRLLILPGDGIGPEITAATRSALEALNQKLALGLAFVEREIGLKALEAEGTTLPPQVLAEVRAADGVVLGRYTNGETRAQGQIVLGNFANPQGLQPLGASMWGETPQSGQALVGGPGTGSLGVLQSSALEDSNVDLTGELVQMITAQRIYQANAQTIKTQDSVLQTLVNLR